MRPHGPCHNCQDRKSGCHSICDLYLDFRDSLDEYNEYKAQERAGDAEYYNFRSRLYKGKSK